MSNANQPHDVSANEPDLRRRPACGAFVRAMPCSCLECAHPNTPDSSRDAWRASRAAAPAAVLAVHAAGLLLTGLG